MKYILFLGSIILASSTIGAPQTPPASTGMGNIINPEKSISISVGDTSGESGQTQQNGYVRPDAKTRRARYFNSMFGPLSLVKVVASAGISTARNTPEEWGPHWDGFGKRVASNLGRRIIDNSVTFGLDEALKLDSHFYRSEKKNFSARFGNAFISAFTARKEDGKRVIGIPSILGVYTANVVADETWYPKRYTYKDGLKSGTISLGLGVVYNLITEFIHKK